MTPNTAARNEAANDFAADYGTAVLTLLSAGAAVLATHTLAGFGASASGVITANAIASETVGANAGAGTAVASAELTAGGLVYTLTVGTSGTDVIMSPDTTLVENGTSNISSLTVTF